MAGKAPSEGEIRELKQALTTSNLRAPNRLEEMLLSNKKGFEGEVGLSLFEMLNPWRGKVPGSLGTPRGDSSSMKKMSRNSTMELDIVNDNMLHTDLFEVCFDPAAATVAGTEDEQGKKSASKVAFATAVLEVLETVDDWFFDAFELERVTGGHPVTTLSAYLFKRLNLLETFKIPERQFFDFLLKIESGYPQNAYHNRVHCANVVQSMYILLTRGFGPKLAGDKTMVSGLLAAIIHDYEHKGVNNDFLIRFQDETALKYNDRSPQENHHIAAAFEVMLTKPFDIFSNTSVEVFTEIRKAIIDMVLATDMKLHFNLLGRFRLIEKKVEAHQLSENHHTGGGTVVAPQEPGAEGLEALLPEDISLCFQVALKCADIGHVYCESNVHLRWVQKLEQEFFAQGDREAEMGAVQKSPLMDRDKAGITKSQCGFFKVVVLPLFKSFSTAFPSVSPVIESIETNLALWAKIEEEQLEISEVFQPKNAAGLIPQSRHHSHKAIVD